MSDVAALAQRDAAGLLRNHHGDGVGQDGDADGGAVAQSEVGRDVLTVGDGQDSTGRHQTVVADDQGSVVQRTVFEKDVLYQLAGDGRVNLVARSDNLVQRGLFFKNDKGAGF